MTQEDKTINVKSSVVVKKSPDCRQVTHKVNASLTEEEAIERHIIGNFEDESDDDGTAEAQS
jgi:hypothetical protein